MDKKSNYNNNFIGRFVGIPGKMSEHYIKILIRYHMFRCFGKHPNNKANSHQTECNVIIVTINSANVTGIIKKVILSKFRWIKNIC